MALTKADLANRLVEERNWDHKDAAALVNSFFEIIRESLAQGNEVKLSGFGNFELRDKRERPGLNPKTGETIPVTARRVVTFKPGNSLKQCVGEYADSARDATGKPESHLSRPSLNARNTKADRL